MCCKKLNTTQFNFYYWSNIIVHAKSKSIDYNAIGNKYSIIFQRETEPLLMQQTS